MDFQSQSMVTTVKIMLKEMCKFVLNVKHQDIFNIKV